MDLIAINASHSLASTTHNVAALAVELHGSGRVVDLVRLDPAALLGVGQDDAVSALLGDIPGTEVLVLVTPIYRATYSGLLKVLFDQLPVGALGEVRCVLAGTAASPAHYLALDTGLRALVASLDGWSVPTVAYATPSDFVDDKQPGPAVRERLAAALAEAARITPG
jgi:FMN reductase